MANIFRRICATCKGPVVPRSNGTWKHADNNAHDHAVGKVESILVAENV